ncbi:hypothetical protein LTR62_005942 [Meristemomyces frigidus]|uniref:Uncharacterized protein n=1 Tax=Meristemomyces frigidus TaxID=1508187 RepID=A0AAN7THY1_9PEZI|nr:hypothetical protein LTR62_005942 [Meristemomyces frigidus]
MAEDALLSITRLLQSLPTWIADIEAILKDGTARQKEMLSERQPTDSPVVAKWRRRSSMLSLRSDEHEKEDDHTEARLEPDVEEQSLLADIALLQPQLRHMTGSDALRLSQRKRKTASVCSDDDECGGPAKYRCRGMVVIYYDGDIQKRFDSLVRAVQTSRHGIRKASVASVATSKRLAQRVSSGSEFEDAPEINALDKYKISRVRQREVTPTPPDETSEHSTSLDRIDLLLERGQDLCERAAHQVLRDGDCALELSSAVQQLHEAKNVAEAQLPALQKSSDALVEQKRESESKRRRRGLPDVTGTRISNETTSTPPVPGLVVSLPSESSLEVDDDAEADEDDDEEFDASAFAIGKFNLRSTKVLIR